jgi:hypothetical protein
VSPGILDGSLLCGAHPVLDLGEGLLDRIEIGRVRRQIPEPGAGRSDHAAERRRFVAAEIVHDDDVALLEDRNELLLDIGAEAFAVDRAVSQDYVLAHMWYNLAAAGGLEDAVKNRDILTTHMTPAQIAEAQKLARRRKALLSQRTLRT